MSDCLCSDCYRIILRLRGYEPAWMSKHKIETWKIKVQINLEKLIGTEELFRLPDRVQSYIVGG